MSDKGGAPARMRVVASGERRGAAPAEASAAAASGSVAEAGASAAPGAQPSLWLPAGLFILGSVAGGAGAAWWLL